MDAVCLWGNKFIPLSPPQESSYVFREGMLPPHRQMFYQLCDLDVERYDHGTPSAVSATVAVFSSAKGSVVAKLDFTFHQDAPSRRRWVLQHTGTEKKC